MGTVPEEAGIFNWFFEPQLQKSKDYVNQGGKIDMKRCSQGSQADNCRSVTRRNIQSR